MSDLYCKGCNGPRDEGVEEAWWHLRTYYGDEPPSLLTACRGAILGHLGRGFTLKESLFRSFKRHRNKPGVSFYHLSRCVHYSLGLGDEFEDNRRAAKRRKKLEKERAQQRPEPAAKEDQATVDEACAVIGRLAEALGKHPADR
jgi:hypothetical protein